MKSYSLTFICLVFLSVLSTNGNAQADKSTRPSPPMEIIGKLQDAQVSISYSSPSVKGRNIWGDLVPYGKVWRTGANEATTFETDKDLVIHDQKLPAGKYALLTIPGETEWTWIFNAVWDQWGAYKYDESKDVLRINTVPQKSSINNEQLRFEIVDDKVMLYWENLLISL